MARMGWQRRRGYADDGGVVVFAFLLGISLNGWIGSSPQLGYRRAGWRFCIGVDARMMRRWWSGTKPDAGHLIALFTLAVKMGLLPHPLPLPRPRHSGGQRIRVPG